MFGLTKREQRWKAEQKAAETLIPMITAITVEAMKQDDKNAEISALRADNTRLQNEIVAPLRERIKELEETNKKCIFAVSEYNKAIQHLHAEVRRLNETL